MDWLVVYVYDVVQAGVADRQIPTLVITGVPEDAGEAAIRRAIARAGRTPVDHQTPWANHRLVRASEALAVDLAYVPILPWARALGTWDRRLTVRLDAELHQLLVVAAARDTVSLNTWCVTALQAAVAAAESPEISQTKS